MRIGRLEYQEVRTAWWYDADIISRWDKQ